MSSVVQVRCFDFERVFDLIWSNQVKHTLAQVKTPRLHSTESERA
jgi:hypothetical protein